jgi:putative DNA primase/helicase
VPLLRDITETPVITSEGKIIVEPGYQPDSKLWYCPALGFVVPPVADLVTVDMAVAARDALLEVLCDFIFEDDASRAHALAYLLLPFMRELIDGPTPLHGISAPRRGTGKGLLTDVGSLISTGKPARMFSWKDDDAELAKTITSFLIANAGGVLGVDNMEGTVASGVLARLLTSMVWSERLLGTNSISGGGGVPNRAVWFVNGNNISFSDEIERRTVYIRLLSDREDPETRGGFRHPKLKEYVAAERGRLVHAALSLARYAYQLREAGLPARGLLGSFEAYDELMGGLLAGIEVPGWMGNREALRSKSTDEVEEWRELVYLWMIQEWGKNLPAGAVYERARIANVLPERYVSTAADMTREFGKALAKLEGQVIGAYRVTSRSKGGRQLYSVTPVGG